MIGEHAEELSKAAMVVLRRHAPSLFTPEGQLLPSAAAQASVRPGGTGPVTSPCFATPDRAEIPLCGWRWETRRNCTEMTRPHDDRMA